MTERDTRVYSFNHHVAKAKEPRRKGKKERSKGDGKNLKEVYDYPCILADIMFFFFSASFA